MESHDPAPWGAYPPSLLKEPRTECRMKASHAQGLKPNSKEIRQPVRVPTRQHKAL